MNIGIQNNKNVSRNINYARQNMQRPPALHSADTVSFTAMKKNEFKGIDLVVVNAFRAPVEKFNTNEDFQNWCSLKTDEIKNKNFGGRQPETIEQRKHLLKEWSDYVLDKDSVYTNSIALLILDGVTKNLKENNDKLPPVLDRRVLADTIDEIYTRSADNKAQFNFNKIYQTKLMNFYLEDTNDINTGETKTGWVKIPSYSNNSENFESNVDRLKILSHPNWCTKSFNARPYLQKGDFHVYLENGKPKIGIRLVDDEIVEIQCEKNNGKIALAYIDEVQKYVDGNNFRLNEASAKEIETAAKAKIDSIKIKADLKDAIETNDAKAIYNYFGIETEENDDKTLTISFYRQPKNLTFEDLGIDENKIFENVKKIKHYADFRGSSLTNLGKLEYIGADTSFACSKIRNLGNLKYIGGKAIFMLSQIQSLENLEYIGGDAEFNNSKIKNLGNLKEIHGDVNFEDSEVEDLNMLQYVGGSVNLMENSLITSLKNLQKIDGSLNLCDSALKDLGELEYIGQNVNFDDSGVKNLNKLAHIGGTAYFFHSNVEDLGNLKYIGEDAVFRSSKITNLSNLEYIGRDADFRYSNVTELGALKSIGRNIDIRYSNFTKKDFEGIATDKNKIIDNENTNPVLRMLKNVIDIFKPVTIRNRQEK